MNTKQIDYVLELSHALNFSRAAENLYISQPSLTYQIQILENEIGFTLFERSGKGASLTPAGEQFCQHLRRMKDELKLAIEQGQNFSQKYSEVLNVCLPMRSALYFLPQIMQKFKEEFPTVALNIQLIYDNSRIDTFLKGEHDILFARESTLSKISYVINIPLFHSHIYCVTLKNDPLAKQNIVTADDLTGRTFMIGGDSPPELIAVQNRIVNNVTVEVVNSPNHETTLTNIAAGNGISLIPGFCNDHNGEFAWIPFDCPETIYCVFSCRSDDRRHSTRRFIELAQSAYSDTGFIQL